MERCCNALQAEWFHTRAASLVAPESVELSVYVDAIRFCEKVRLEFSLSWCSNFCF